MESKAGVVVLGDCRQRCAAGQLLGRVPYTQPYAPVPMHAAASIPSACLLAKRAAQVLSRIGQADVCRTTNEAGRIGDVREAKRKGQSGGGACQVAHYDTLCHAPMPPDPAHAVANRRLAEPAPTLGCFAAKEAACEHRDDGHVDLKN